MKKAECESIELKLVKINELYNSYINSIDTDKFMEIDNLLSHTYMKLSKILKGE